MQMIHRCVAVMFQYVVTQITFNSRTGKGGGSLPQAVFAISHLTTNRTYCYSCFWHCHWI